MAQYRDVNIGTMKTILEQKSDGSMRVRVREELPVPARSLTDRLDHWASVTPDRIYLAQRDNSGGWRTFTYAQARKSVRHISAGLLQRNLSTERPVAILSGNDIEQALLMLACMYVGVPVAPVSPAYSLIATDYGKIGSIIDRLTPGLIYATNATPFGKAILATCPENVEICAGAGEIAGQQITPFSHLLDAPDGSQVDVANAKVGPDTIAKILFTSGSTGLPKGVINTQRMLCANQMMIAHWLAFAKEEPPVIVDWLPWHHTFGGNHNFGFVLNNGGTFYIDEGKPTPSGMAETIRNLREISPTVYFNVPKGYEELALRLRADKELRERFYARLRLTIYAGANLPAHVTHDLESLARETIGTQVRMITSLGSTETAPAALSCTLTTCQPGVVGLPLPGVELKLVPASGKLEVRVKGPNIMPGYWRDAEQTQKAFDEDGFYRLGDALKFKTQGDPNGGFIFDGRVSEDFKLATGTWVSVGPLRAKLVSAFAPYVKDAVIAGHDRDDIMALLLPEIEACRGLLGPLGARLEDSSVLASQALRTELQGRLLKLAAESTGSSTRVARVLFLIEPPSIDHNEITDKGSLNQRAILTRRAEIVDALYAPVPPAAAICV